MKQQPDFNPSLREWERPAPTSEPGAGTIERPGHPRNLVWQTRSRAPNAYELHLVQALEQAFSNGATEPGEVVAQLNQLGVRDHAGEAWSETSFKKAMASLGC